MQDPALPRAGLITWITGYSAAGKTTVARLLRDQFASVGLRPILLDGDTLRRVLGREKAFSMDDRVALAWTYARLCHEFSSQGFHVICATISMFHAVRSWNRTANKTYCEIYLRAPKHELILRDPKGHYARADVESGPMIGLDEIGEEPISSDLIIDNWGAVSADQTAMKIWRYIVGKGEWLDGIGAATR